jgi:hypothetical protein
LQGIGWFIRKGIALSTVTLTVKQYVDAPSESTEPVTHIDIVQTTTGGFQGTTENRCIDGLWREHEDWLFGQVKGQSTWVKAEEITDPYLAKNWEESDAEKSGPNGETHIRSYVERIDGSWTAEQIWGFQMINGGRMYARNIVVKSNDERVDMRLVYRHES